MWTVYMHTCPNDKRYVGITSRRTYERWQYGYGYERQKNFYEAIKSFGWDNIKHEVIAVVDNVEDAVKLENQYIAKYHSADPEHGYNSSDKTIINKYGKPAPLHSSRTKKRLSESAKARPMSTRNLAGLKEHRFTPQKGTKHKITYEGFVSHRKACAKMVVQYDSEMKPISVYDGADTAVRKNGFNVYNPLQTGYKGKGCIWKYYNTLDERERNRIKNAIHKIHVLTMDNEVVERSWKGYDKA